MLTSWPRLASQAGMQPDSAVLRWSSSASSSASLATRRRMNFRNGEGRSTVAMRAVSLSLPGNRSSAGCPVSVRPCSATWSTSCGESGSLPEAVTYASPAAGAQLGAVLPRYLLGGHPVVEQRRLDLGPGLLPDALAARGREHPQLYRVVPVYQDDLLDDAVLTGLDPDLDLRYHRDPQRAQV